MASSYHRRQFVDQLIQRHGIVPHPDASRIVDRIGDGGGDRDDQRLSERMRMPCCAGAWFECYLASSDAGWLVVANTFTCIAYRGEWRLSIEAMRRAQDLVDRTDASRRILLGGADQLIPTQQYLFRSLAVMGFIDEAVETTERFLQTIDRIERPFDIVWALMVRCNLCALLGQDDVLLQEAANTIEISERHGYTARRGNGLSLRGLARSRLGELNAGIDDARKGVEIWRGQGVVINNTPEQICVFCDLLVQAGRLDEASQLLDEADALVVGTDHSCALAECMRIRGQIDARGNDLTGAVRLFEKAIGISQRQEARLFELRSTTQLASVLARQGRGEEGEPRLRAIIDSFDTKHESSILPLLEKCWTRCSDRLVPQRGCPE